MKIYQSFELALVNHKGVPVEVKWKNANARAVFQKMKELGYELLANNRAINGAHHHVLIGVDEKDDERFMALMSYFLDLVNKHNIPYSPQGRCYKAL